MKDSQVLDSSIAQYCLAVGYISTTWAALERSIDELIWELAGTSPEIGACITAQMIGPGPRLRALLSLVREWKADEMILAKFRHFAKSTESLGAKRNRYAHDTVHISLMNGYLIKNEITAAKQLRFLSEKVDITKMLSLWREISKIYGELTLLRDDLIVALPAWTNRHSELPDPN